MAERDLSGGIVCTECGKKLASYDPQTDNHIPPPEELYAQGAVPVPNFGWFCSQDCGWAYQNRTGIKFDRQADGKIDYYAK
jgi:hypothetical protein